MDVDPWTIVPKLITIGRNIEKLCGSVTGLLFLQPPPVFFQGLWQSRCSCGSIAWKPSKSNCHSLHIFRPDYLQSGGLVAIPRPLTLGHLQSLPHPHHPSLQKESPLFVSLFHIDTATSLVHLATPAIIVCRIAHKPTQGCLVVVNDASLQPAPKVTCCHFRVQLLPPTSSVPTSTPTITPSHRQTGLCPRFTLATFRLSAFRPANWNLLKHSDSPLHILLSILLLHLGRQTGLCAVLILPAQSSLVSF